MNDVEVLDISREAVFTLIKVVSPVLLVALFIGLIIGIFQALTQIQEMTLTFVPKIGLMLVVFWVSMSFMTATLASFFGDQILPQIAGS